MTVIVRNAAGAELDRVTVGPNSVLLFTTGAARPLIDKLAQLFDNTGLELLEAVHGFNNGTYTIAKAE